MAAIELELTDLDSNPVDTLLLVTSQEKPLSKCDLELQFTTGENWSEKHGSLFLQLSRMVKKDQFSPVHKTESINQTDGEVQWGIFSLSLKTLCDANIDRMVKFQCIEITEDGRERDVGNFHRTVRQLQSQANMENPSPFALLNSKGEV